MAHGTYTPVAAGATDKGWYNGSDRKTRIERVTPSHGAYIAVLNTKLPPRSRLIWASLNNIAAITNQTTGDGTNTATGYSLIRVGTDTSTNSLAAATASSSTHILVLTTNTSSNTTTNNVQAGFAMPTNATSFQNTTTQDIFLALVPSLASSNRINYATSGTAAFYFGTSTATSTSSVGVVDVYITVETFVDQVVPNK